MILWVSALGWCFSTNNKRPHRKSSSEMAHRGALHENVYPWLGLTARLCLTSMVSSGVAGEHGITVDTLAAAK